MPDETRLPVQRIGQEDAFAGRCGEAGTDWTGCRRGEGEPTLSVLASLTALAA